LIHVAVGFHQILEADGIHAGGNFLVKFPPGVLGKAFGLQRAKPGIDAVYRFQGAFYRPQNISHGYFIRAFSGNITSQRAPDTMNESRLSQGDKNLFQVSIGYAGIFRDGSGTGKLFFGKQGHKEERLQGIPALG
jgi:hypothetical protein